MSKYAIGDKIITPSGNIGDVSSVRGQKIIITWKNGLSAEYTAKQLQAWNYRKFLEEKEAIAYYRFPLRNGTGRFAPSLHLLNIKVICVN